VFASISQNWISLIQTAALVGSLFLIGFALLLDVRNRRVGNLIMLTQQHRELWERMYTQPELTRILDPAADISEKAIKPEEEKFVIFVILHLSTTFYAMRAGFFQKPQGLQRDIKRFFSLPLPREVWHKMKDLQDRVFVAFVDRFLNDESPAEI
jgi:hypothetical protein